MITVSPDNTSGAYGWCTCWKAWKDKDDTSKDGGYFEINMCAEHLTRPFENVCATMLHEMTHLYNLKEGIQDCSRGGTYHNKRFKAAAEAHGLVIDHHEKYGWTITNLNDEAKAFIANLDSSGFHLRRDPMPKALKSGGGRSSSRKYVCPGCGLIIRATKEVSVICADCNEMFELEEG